MAIPVLNDLDLLNSGQILKFRVENAAASGYSNAEAGGLIYDSGSLKFYNGSSWVTLGTGSGSGTVTQVDGGNGLTGSVTSSGSLAVGAGTGITVNANDVAVTAAQTGITSVLNTSLKVGRANASASDHEYVDFATDGMIKLSVNGNEARWNGSAFVPGTDDASDLGSSTKQWRNLYIDGTAEVDALSINGTAVSSTAAELNILDGVTSTTAELNILDGVTSTAAELNILDGKSFLDEDDMSSDSATGIASQQSIKAYVDGKTYDDVSVANLKIALAGGFGSNAVQIGDSTDTVTIPGNLVVSGTQTIQNETIQVVENNTIQFEGTTADDYEIKLTAADATSSDKTITLPNLSGHAALFASAPTATISATPAELNIMDGVTATTSEINILDGVTATASEINVLDGFAGVTADLTYAKDLRATGVTTTEFDKLDGLTATTSELNILDGVTATASELNILDGVTATTSELNILDGVTATATEINLLDGITTLSGSNTGDEVAADETTAGILEVADAGEARAGTNNAKILTPHNLNDRHAKAEILTASIDSTALKAVVPHSLGTKEVLVEVFGVTTGERYIAEYHTDNNGSSSSNHLTFHFSVAPSENLYVYIVSVQGTGEVTPTYPTS
jgi:hypothetical protein